ncbi:uncharacterized protein [Diadema setosum]|uniref:uncharacterized protein n=1 Tax=Diadema setosum TaxID=31175 RepID=UPI003B3AF722
MASWSRLVLLLVLLVIRVTYSAITEIRLIGGLSPHEGTVEYKLDGGNNWESTCGVNLGINDVIVICNHLGFPGGNRAVKTTPFAAPSTPPQSILQCDPDDVTLADCDVIPNQNCASGDAGAAICYGDGYLGCFVDSPVGRVLGGDTLIDDSMNISLCLEFCRASGTEHQYAGLENGNECYCGAPGTDYSRLGEGTELNCQTKCKGSSESCGGSPHIAVFERLYAGVGAAAAVVIIIVVVIAIIFIQKRSRPRYKDTSQKTVLSSPTLATDNMENVYDGIYNEVEDHGATVYTEKPHQDMDQSGDLYYSSVHDEIHNGPTAKNARASERNAHADDDVQMIHLKLENNGKAMNGDLSVLYAMPDKNDSGATDSMAVHALYAMPDKKRDADHAPSSADFGDLYAKPDKSRGGTDAPGSADFGDLYAKPDKNRPAPEGKEDIRMDDLYAMPDKTRPQHSVGDDVYSTVDAPDNTFRITLANDHSGMYAEASGETLDEDGDVEMVENELYKM